MRNETLLRQSDELVLRQVETSHAGGMVIDDGLPGDFGDLAEIVLEVAPPQPVVIRGDRHQPVGAGCHRMTR